MKTKSFGFSSRAFSSSLQSMITKSKKMLFLAVRSNLLHKMPLGELFLQQSEYADVLNRFSLNDSEIGLLCAVMIFNPGIDIRPMCFFVFLDVAHRLKSLLR